MQTILKYVLWILAGCSLALGAQNFSLSYQSSIGGSFQDLKVSSHYIYLLENERLLFTDLSGNQVASYVVSQDAGSIQFLSLDILDDQYLFLATTNLLEIYDLTTISAMTRTSYIDLGTLNSQYTANVTDVTYKDNYLVLAYPPIYIDAMQNYEVVDIANITTPSIVSRSIRAAIDDNYLYSIENMSYGAFLQVKAYPYSENDNAWYYQVDISSQSAGSMIDGFAINDNYFYISYLLGNGQHAFDITDLNTIAYHDYYTTAKVLTVHDNYLYTVDNGNIEVWDVSDPANALSIFQTSDGFYADNEIYKAFANDAQLFVISQNRGLDMYRISFSQTFDKRDFAARLYTTLLGRDYDQGGLDYYVSQLEQGKSALEVAKAFFFSDEFQNANLSITEYLTRLYKTFLDRDPDQGGLDYWSEQITNKGKTRRLVFYEFAFSPEFQQLAAKYGIVPFNAHDKLVGFIERLYVLVMGRESDEGGMDYWVGKLTAKEKSASDIVKDFYNAPEFQNKYLSDSAFIANAYNAVMGREADIGGLNYWISQMNGGLSRDGLLDNFLHAQEFITLANEYGIDPFTEDLPKDFEIQPSYNGTAHHVSDDDDRDGTVNVLEGFPSDGTKSTMQTVTESEFNNNIGQANAIENNQAFPFAINGALKKGSDYYLDSDYYRVDVAQGQRLSFIVFKGNSDVTQPLVDTDFASICKPLVAVLDENGKKISGKPMSFFDGNINGIGIQAAQSGSVYLQISDSTLVASDYDCSYAVIAIEDTDFDGVSNAMETLLQSNKEHEDTDGDDITDFMEVYPFIAKYQGINAEVITSGKTWWDIDKDGIPNWYDVDSDGDHMPDKRESVQDFDQDGIPNFLDIDSNDDGIGDRSQSGGSYQYPSDIDQDGTFDFADMDIDGDGIPNGIDSDAVTSMDSNDVFEEDAIEISHIEAVIDADTVVPDIVMINHTLHLYARNIDSGVNVLLPTKGGNKVVQPKSVIDEKIAVDVPDDVISGAIYLVDSSTLSSSYYGKVVDIEKDPVIYEVSPLSVSRGEKITIRGKNLSEEQINVVFANGKFSVRSAGNVEDNSVEVYVPQDAPSGLIYIEVTSDIVTNKLPFSIKKETTVSVALPYGSNVSYDEVSILGNGQDVSVNSAFSANMLLNNETIDYIAAFATRDDESYLLYESIVLPGDTSVVMNSLSTAVKWVFFGLRYDRNRPQSEWPDIIDTIRTTVETVTLANYIDTLLNQNISALSRFDDAALLQYLQNATVAAGEAVNAMLATRSVRSTTVPLQGEILPRETQDDITLSFEVAAQDEVNTLVTNGSNMYLSIKAVNENKKELSGHITHPFDSSEEHGMVGPTGWIYYSTKLIENDSEDTHFEIITGGCAGDLKDPVTAQKSRVQRYLFIRTLFDGAITPVVDSLLSYVADKKLNGQQSYQLVIALIGTNQWTSYMDAIEADPSSMGQVVVNVVKTAIWDKGIKACANDLTSPVCEKFLTTLVRFLPVSKADIIKNITKKILAYEIPILGQVKLVVDNAGHIKNAGTAFLTGTDFLMVNEQIDFDVEFGLEINEVLPSCISADSDVDHLNVYASGVNPVQAHFWGGEYINPEVYLGGTKLDIYSISKYWGGSWGKQINIKLTDSIKSGLSDGQYILTVKDGDDQVEYEDMINVYIDSISIESIYPDKGSTGSTVTLYGCGWSKNISENRVLFPNDSGGRTDAVITKANPGFLEVIVPDDAVTGDVYATYKFNNSNRVPFTIESDNVTITYGDNGADNDDTFELFVDNQLVSSMSAPRRPFPVEVELAQGRHSVKLVGITAPDDVGTYSISFSSNVSVVSGPSQSGNDLTAGVTKTWVIEVESISRSRSVGIEQREIPIIHYNIANE